MLLIRWTVVGLLFVAGIVKFWNAVALTAYICRWSDVSYEAARILSYAVACGEVLVSVAVALRWHADVVGVLLIIAGGGFATLAWYDWAGEQPGCGCFGAVAVLNQPWVRLLAGALMLLLGIADTRRKEMLTCSHVINRKQ